MITQAHKTELARLTSKNAIGVDLSDSKRLKIFNDLVKGGYVVPMTIHGPFKYFKLNS
jgi:hypothetical protein